MYLDHSRKLQGSQLSWWISYGNLFNLYCFIASNKHELCVTLNITTLHYFSQHYPTLLNTALPYIPLHSTTQCYLTPHSTLQWFSSPALTALQRLHIGLHGRCVGHGTVIYCTASFCRKPRGTGIHEALINPSFHRPSVRPSVRRSVCLSVYIWFSFFLH